MNDDPINAFSNHGWPGATASDALVYLNQLFQEPTQTSTYWRAWDRYYGYTTNQRMVLNLGGNGRLSA